MLWAGLKFLFWATIFATPLCQIFHYVDHGNFLAFGESVAIALIISTVLLISFCISPPYRSPTKVIIVKPPPWVHTYHLLDGHLPQDLIGEVLKYQFAETPPSRIEYDMYKKR